jgi:tricorn protease
LSSRQPGCISPSAPDNSAIALYDHTGKVHVVDLQGRATEVYASDYGAVTDYSWAPDSQWLAFTVLTAAGTTAIRIWSRANSRLLEASDGRFNARGPAFGADGKHLYFLSDREFAPQIAMSNSTTPATAAPASLRWP